MILSLHKPAYNLYYSQNSEQPLKIPVAFDIIAKYGYCDIKSKTELRKSSYTKKRANA